MWALASLTLWLSTASLFAQAATPYLTAINSTQWFLSNGDSFDLTLNSEGYAYSIQWNGRELVRNATGGYVDYGGRNTINITSQPEIITQTDDQIHVAFDSYYATVHYILFSNLPGHYQYVVNKNLGVQGEIRSLWRLDPVIFTKGRTNCRDDVLPTIGQIQAGVNVQDETWIRQDGGYITKYDFSCFVRSLDYHGVYGDGVGAWIIAPGKDYYIGDHMKQELMVHRETKTNDAVMLHYFHGTHYMSDFANTIPDGKLWGPWLFYVNDGDMSDVANRVQQEDSQWPYPWLNDTQYQTRATVKGRLVLSDGRAAAGAAVFLGDENGWETNNQGTYFQYTTYASDDGYFEFENVRTEKDYRLIAWSNGGQVIPDVDGVHNGTMVSMNATTSTKRDGGAVVDLGEVTWDIPQREVWWRIGEFDKKTSGFNGGGLPYQHGRSDITPSNLVYSIGTNKTSDWYFAQSGLGNWSVLFDPVPPEKSNTSATLTLQFAGFTSRSGFNPNDTTVSGLNVSMNYQFVKTIGSDRPSDKSLYRSATIAGAYYTQQLEIPSEMLKSDKFNRLDLSITATQRWRGVMWDALKLEWN